MQNEKKIHKRDTRYHTFLQDAKLIIVPSWEETLQVSLIIILLCIISGLFFVGAGRLISSFLKILF